MPSLQGQWDSAVTVDPPAPPGETGDPEPQNRTMSAVFTVDEMERMLRLAESVDRFLHTPYLPCRACSVRDLIGVKLEIARALWEQDHQNDVIEALRPR